MEIIYSNMTGGSIIYLLKVIDLLFIEDSYTDYAFTIPRTCIKHIYPITDHFICITEDKKSFEVFEYKGFYHFKLNDNLLTIYDCNKKNKIKYTILLTDEKLKNIQKILSRYNCMINYVNSDF